MQQTTFPLSCDELLGHPDEFIQSESNSLAHNAIINWPNNWGVDPYPCTLLIKGPICSGKSHLAGIWAKASGALFITKDYLLTEEIINNHKGFIIDDINNFGDQKTLLHHFNIINENKKYLLLTQSGEVDFILPDLISRIRSVNKVVITSPDDELIRALIFKIFSSFSVVVSREVINYMLKVIPREFNKIIYYTNLVNDYALRYKRKITISLLKELLEKN
jgi:chromosomal replication initiation ATPase DnaA